ncbi:MAG TPA: phosphatase PAP2 family protein [Ignavibacteriaceae bacterium]|nr:phosphatase PAP2 family protein [Ignavibacteriaceae bacterium]
MKIKLTFIFGLLFFCNIFLNAQDEIANDSTSATDSLNLSEIAMGLDEIKSDSSITWHQMITKVPKDIYEFSGSALNSNQIPLFAGLAAATGALYLIDREGWNFNKRLFDTSPPFHTFSDIGVDFGNETYHLILAGVFAAYGLADDNSRALKTASNVVEALIASGISVQIFKRIFGRESPELSTQNSGYWKLFPNLAEYQRHQPKYYAYPSGHITTLTATVTVLANNYPEVKWIKPVGYAMIAICGMGLVSRGMHWYSDLPMGIFLGYTFGNLIAPEIKINNDENNISENSIKFSPFLFSKDIGLAISYTF